VVKLSGVSGPVLLHIKGNAGGGSNFAVWSNGTSKDLLVNTVESYDGIRPLNLEDGAETTSLEINASGKWSIEVLPLTAARVVDGPATITGKGDDVIHSLGAPSTLKIRGNNGGVSNFAVWAYTSEGRDLLVNTVDPYDGRVAVDGELAALVVEGEGAWSITQEP
jgi:hypothetical protein